MKAFHDPDEFPFSMALEAACGAIRAEALSLSPDDFVDWPEALTTARDGYDESGWRFFGLFSSHDQDVHELYDLDANRRRCPETVRACAAIPGMTDAGFSAFLPGTHLWPHRGELAGLLRCHLPLVVAPTGQGLKVGGETRAWQQGRCLVFDDRVQHEAWNHASTTRIVLIVTFRWPQTSV